jgi:hypothetical protein
MSQLGGFFQRLVAANSDHDLDSKQLQQAAVRCKLVSSVVLTMPAIGVID